MKKLKQIWNNLTVFWQLAIAFAVLFLVQVAATALSYGFVHKVVYERMEESYQSTLKQTALSVDTTIVSIKNSADDLFNDADLLLPVKKFEELTVEESISERSWEVRAKLDEVLMDYLMYRNDITSVSLMTESGRVYSRDRQAVELLFPDIIPTHEEWFREGTIDSLDGVKGVWLPTRYMRRSGTRETYAFSYGKKIRDGYTGKRIGKAIISIDEEVLNTICRNGQINKDKTVNLLFITDKDDCVISHYDKEKIGQDIGEVLSDFRRTNNSKELLLMEEMPRTGWKIYSVLNEDYMFRQVNQIEHTAVAIIMMLALLILAAIFLVSKRMTNNITSVVQIMDLIELGKMNAKIQIDRGEQNEIKQIAEHFNQMMETINRQMDIIRTSGEKEKNAEIRALEAQINPHFIYNTLDAINWLALENDQFEISEMLSKFALILRYQIQKSNKIVQIDEELEYLQYYLYLQRERMMNSFEYVIDCQERVKQCRIHKMIFQPFIENAVVHGIAGLEYGGLIRIRIHELDDEHLSFSVSDNGKGMTKEQIHKIFEERTNPGNSIGIINVLERLDLYYGGKHEVIVTSTEGAGTTIEAIIPKEAMEEG